MPTQHEISPDDRRLLDFEMSHPSRDARKTTVLHEQLRMLPSRYYQRLFELVIDPAVVVESPSCPHE